MDAPSSSRPSGVKEKEEDDAVKRNGAKVAGILDEMAATIREYAADEKNPLPSLCS